MYIHFPKKYRTCPACLGRCIIIVHDGPDKAHSEICPLCGGTGQVLAKEMEIYEPYEPWYPNPYYRKLRRWDYWDTNITAGNVHEFNSTIIS